MKKMNDLEQERLESELAKKDKAIEKMKNSLSYFVDQNPTWPEDGMAFEIREGFMSWLREGRKLARQCLEDLGNERD